MLHALIVKLRQGASISRFCFSFYHICIFLLSQLNRIWDGHWAYLGAQNEFQKAPLKWTQSYMLTQLSSIILNKNCWAQNEFQKAPLKWTQSYMLAQLSSIILNKNFCMSKWVSKGSTEVDTLIYAYPTKFNDIE